MRTNGYQVRVPPPLPRLEDFQRYERKTARATTLRVQGAPEAAQKAHEQAERQAWRALPLVIKARLEAVESGITSIEQEFLSNMVLPDNSTVAETMLPRPRETVTGDHLPPVLPATHSIALVPAAQ